MEEANKEGNDNINGFLVEETQEQGNDGINGDMDEAQEQGTDGIDGSDMDETENDGINDSDMDEAQEQGSDGIRHPKTLKNEERETIYRILLQNYQGMSTGDVRHRKTQNCDRKRVQIDVAQFQSIPLSKRSTFRCMATTLNASKYVCQRLHKKGLFRCHSNAIKPKLTPKNKIAKLRFCIKMLEDDSIPEDPTFNGGPRFDEEGNELFLGKIRCFAVFTQQPAKIKCE
ncbi:hypothetical protein COLO4_33793 [Corchorus olitorius]|uniref:Transposase Tc1-like domain-containing protein n=1 Tax=Corchorus olitorius TaxID=93759 RepID=A0A1R3GRI2_9ROSI|nr:hypothetical protein COLO4_33793 [Corchorus olitorius]